MSETIDDEENLWGDIPLDVKIQSPVAILREQAQVLSKVAKGTLAGRVDQFQSKDGRLGYELKILVPALKNYSVAVASVMYPPTLYPATVWGDLSTYDVECADEHHLKAALRDYLQSKEVRGIIVALISQARDSGAIEKKEGDDIPF